MARFHPDHTLRLTPPIPCGAPAGQVLTLVGAGREGTPSFTRGQVSGRVSATIEHIARAFAATVAARPLLCRVTSIFPSILEHNISAERMLEFKHGLLAVRKETALDFHACVPSISEASFERCIHLGLPLVIGLWPLSHPAKLAVEVIGLPEMAALRYRFQHDLEEGLLMLLRSLPSE